MPQKDGRGRLTSYDADSHTSPYAGRLLSLACLIAFLSGLLYVVTIRPWDLFDEDAYVGYVQTLRDEHRIPTFADPIPATIRASEIATQRWKGLHLSPPPQVPNTTWWFGDHLYESDQPPLYPAVVVPFALAGGHDELRTLYAIRMLGPFLMVILVILTWKLARLWVPTSAVIVPFAAATFVAVTPAVGESAGRVDMDLLVGVLITTVLWACTRLGQQPSTARAVGVALASLAAVLTKETGLFTLPIIGMTLIYLMQRTRRWTITLGIIALAPPILGALAWASWLHSHYGVWESIAAWDKIAHGVVTSLPWTTFLAKVSYSTWSSYWSFYSGGGLRVAISAGLTVLGVAALVGLVLRRKPTLKLEKLGFLLASTLGLTFAAALITSNVNGLFTPEARYLLGLAAPAATAVATGFARLGRSERAALIVPAVGSVFSLAFYLGWFHPFFHGPLSA